MEPLQEIERKFSKALNPKTDESTLRELASFGICLPDSYLAFLRRHNGGVIYHSGDPANHGVHLLTAEDVDFVNGRDDLVAFARIPQVGGYQLAFDPEGRVIDCFGEFPVIASDFTDFLKKLTEGAKKSRTKSLYWL